MWIPPTQLARATLVSYGVGFTSMLCARAIGSSVSGVVSALSLHVIALSVPAGRVRAGGCCKFG